MESSSHKGLSQSPEEPLNLILTVLICTFSSNQVLLIAQGIKFVDYIGLNITQPGILAYV